MTLAALMLSDITLVLQMCFVGLLAGFLASRMMRGRGYGIIGDIIGAFIVGYFCLVISNGLIGTNVIAII
jgi:uncharacterized membrane protein YeaQ/YmgE (transglycosylase-associated protein family)